MSAAKKGLGRSFESLIPTDLLDESFDPTAGADEKVSDLRTIKLSEITVDPDQPRKHFEESALKELAESIREHGVLQPIVVIAHKGKYQIVAGERRFRASQMAGKKSIPALVRTLSAQHKLELSLIENIQRRDLNPLETATAYEKLRVQFNMTLEQIGTRVGGKSVSAVSNTLRLLRLPDVAKQAVASGQLTEGQARPLVGAEPAVVKKLLPQIIDEGWSARKIEHLIGDVKPESVRKTNLTDTKKRFETEEAALSRHLQTNVRITASSRGAGSISIAFANEDDRKRIQKLLEK